MHVRVGVIGAGSWGINHVRAFGQDSRCEVAAIADIDPARRALLTELAPGARWFDSFRELLGHVDAVVIATPAATHVDVAIAALEAGKHVLIEKPMALSLADARRVQAAALRAGTTAMVGHLMVFHPAVRRIREFLQAGSLGRPYYFHATRVNLGRLRTDETALWCFGPHDLSMIDFILGQPPTRVSACGAALLQPGIEDVVFVSLEFATGQLAHLHLSWLHPRKERRLMVVCADKMVELDDTSRDKLRIYDKGYDRPPEFKQFSEFLTLRDGDVWIPSLSMEEPLQVEIRHFLDCIASGACPETDLASGLRITATLEAAQRSLRLGGTPQLISGI